MYWLAWAPDIPRCHKARLPNLKCSGPHRSTGFRRLLGRVSWWSASSRVTFNSMDRAITAPARVIAWLLCAILLCLVIDPPHCDLCDGPLTGTSFSPQAIGVQQQPTTPEPCNGTCWCCGFHGLPNAIFDLGRANTATSDVWAEQHSPVFAPCSPIFRPPRTDASASPSRPAL
jgi:hypothetical protein